MGDCPAPYLQGVIAAFSVIRGSLLETRKLNTMQPVRVGKAETGLFKPGWHFALSSLEYLQFLCTWCLWAILLPVCHHLPVSETKTILCLTSFLSWGAFLSPQLQSLQCLSNYPPCLYPVSPKTLPRERNRGTVDKLEAFNTLLSTFSKQDLKVG